MFYTPGMRWDNLLAGQDAGKDDDGETERAVLPLFPGEAIVRRFKTPQFRGMTFYEVAAKSIINHVPGDRFGFNWTINPFRGCSHACTYCLQGDTPILMATGRTKPLADIRPGEEIRYRDERLDHPLRQDGGEQPLEHGEAGLPGNA